MAQDPARLLCPFFPGENTGAGCQFLLQGALSNPGTELTSLAFPALAGRFFTMVPSGKHLSLLSAVYFTHNLIWYLLCKVYSYTHFSDELESWSSKRLRNLLQVPNSEAGMLEYRLRGLISTYLFFPCIISLCDGGESFGKLLCGVKALVKTFLFFSLQDIQNLGSVVDFSFTGESPFC